MSSTVAQSAEEASRHALVATARPVPVVAPVPALTVVASAAAAATARRAAAQRWG
jgi:hypothetical protein